MFIPHMKGTGFFPCARMYFGSAAQVFSPFAFVTYNCWFIRAKYFVVLWSKIMDEVALGGMAKNYGRGCEIIYREMGHFDPAFWKYEDA